VLCSQKSPCRSILVVCPRQVHAELLAVKPADAEEAEHKDGGDSQGQTPRQTKRKATDSAEEAAAAPTEAVTGPGSAKRPALTAGQSG
jgi:hypothetical protein